MFRFQRPELILAFAAGIIFFALWETILGYQAANCSYQQQYKAKAGPTDSYAAAGDKGHDRGEEQGHKAVSEPFVCGVAGLPTAARLFMNRNEGFFVATFTLALVFVTAWLVWATLKLWRAGEKQFRHARRTAAIQSRDMQASIATSNRAAKAAEDSVLINRQVGESQVCAYLSCDGAAYTITDSWFACDVRIKNHGQSPAIWTEIKAHVIVEMAGTRGDLTGFIYRTSEIVTQVGPAIAAGQEGKIFVVFLHGQMGEGVHDALWKDGKNFDVRGHIGWHDVFGKKHGQGFVLDQKQGGFRLPPAKGERGGEMTSFNRASEHHAQQGSAT
jgi:hypothetical protein